MLKAHTWLLLLPDIRQQTKGKVKPPVDIQEKNNVTPTSLLIPVDILSSLLTANRSVTGGLAAAAAATGSTVRLSVGDDALSSLTDEDVDLVSGTGIFKGISDDSASPEPAAPARAFVLELLSLDMLELRLARFSLVSLCCNCTTAWNKSLKVRRTASAYKHQHT